MRKSDKKAVTWIPVEISAAGQAPASVTLASGQGLAFHNNAAQDYFIRLFIDEQDGADLCRMRNPIVASCVRAKGYAYLIADANRNTHCTFDVMKVAAAGMIKKRKASTQPKTRGGTHKITITSSA